jgi:hypothetical protein
VGDRVAGLDVPVSASGEDRSLFCEDGAEGFTPFRVGPFGFSDGFPEELVVSFDGEDGSPVSIGPLRAHYMGFGGSGRRPQPVRERMGSPFLAGISHKTDRVQHFRRGPNREF